MITAIRRNLASARKEYPPQFWLMFWGMLISTIGSSMIWPFLMIYVGKRLQLPLTNITILMTLNSAVGLVFAFIAGPVTDRLGRKWVMVISLVVNGAGYILLSQATTFLMFALVMALQGAFNPLYRVGADAMMADLIPAEKRADAYSILRMSNNIGVALGPSIGGFIATSSYTLAFYLAAAGLTTYSILLALRAHETLPRREQGALATDIRPQREKLGGYDRILKDRPFVSFTMAFTLTQVCSAMIWVLLSVYAKTNYHVPESQYGLIATTNAIMVVLFQVGVTNITKRYKPLPVLALGSTIYAVAVGSIALGRGFWAFWLSMVVLTIGELILVPTSTTYAANLAPADMRGRYMSIYGLTWGGAAGIGPLLGGVLNDQIGPAAQWYGGAVVGTIAVLVFLRLARQPANPPLEIPASFPVNQSETPHGDYPGND